MLSAYVCCKEKYKVLALVSIIVFLVLSTGCGKAPQPAPERLPEKITPHRPVAGAFYVNGRENGGSYGSFYRNRGIISEVSPLWYYVRKDGSLEEKMDREALALARDSGVKVIPLVAFPSNRSSAVLTGNEARKAAIANIVGVVREHNYDGINMDFEIVKSAGRDYKAELEGLTRFAAELGEEMVSLGKRLDICVLPPEQAPAYLAAIYDYAALSGLSDRLVIMAYDYSNKGTKPGPVAPLPWVEANIKAVLSLGVPPDKISLGIASYGYDWPSGGTGADAVASLEVMRRIAESGLTAGWDGPSRTPYLKYRDSQGRDREIWFENSASVVHKFELINKYRLAGFSLWRLGYEDGGFWPAVGDFW